MESLTQFWVDFSPERGKCKLFNAADVRVVNEQVLIMIRLMNRR